MPFRQIQPEYSKYLGLSDDVQRKHERLMHVNAQVTAVTTMMEFSGNCISFVIFIVLGGHGKFTSSVSIMFLNFVVLSYAFLMNTKYNKNRIIEYGWLNVFKNIFWCNRQNDVSAENLIAQIPKANQSTSIHKNDHGKIQSSIISIVSDDPVLLLRANDAKDDRLHHKVKQSEVFFVPFNGAIIFSKDNKSSWPIVTM